MNRGSLERIDKVDFKYERDIQNLTEENMNQIFGLEFVKSEFQLNNLRMDTLAFDKETNSFVIIEFKRSTNFSVIDQGFAYLALLLNNKADFILEYNESKDISLNRKDVDWSQSRVIFVAPQFTTYQRQAIDFKDLPIELWEVTKYKNKTILFNQLKASQSSESINKLSSKNEIVQKVSDEVKVFTEEDHLENLSDNTKEKYDELKERIYALGDNVEVKPTKLYIAFKSNTNFCDITLQRNKMKLWLNVRKNTLDDPRGMARDVSNVGHWGNGDYEVILNSESDLDYLMTLIRQSYEINS